MVNMLLSKLLEICECHSGTILVCRQSILTSIRILKSHIGALPSAEYIKMEKYIKIEKQIIELTAHFFISNTFSDHNGTELTLLLFLNQS